MSPKQREIEAKTNYLLHLMADKILLGVAAVNNTS